MLPVLSLGKHDRRAPLQRAEGLPALAACILSSLALILTVKPSVWGFKKEKWERHLEGTGPISPWEKSLGVVSTLAWTTEKVHSHGTS